MIGILDKVETLDYYYFYFTSLIQIYFNYLVVMVMIVTLRDRISYIPPVR